MTVSQRNCWEEEDDCPRETPKEVGNYKTTILGCLEQQRTRFTTKREASPLWDP
jgi:hypothetical protein